MNWFDVILGGVTGSLTAIFCVFGGVVGDFISNCIKFLFGLVGVRDGIGLNFLIILVLFVPFVYVIFVLPLSVALPFVTDRFLFSGGWYFGLLIGMMALAFRKGLQDEKRKYGRIRFRIW